jgi:hypothetical protein
MGVIERLFTSWEDGTFAVFAALAWLAASFVSYPQVSAKFVPKAGIEVTAATPSLGPIMVSIEDDDRESQEDDLELSGLPGLRFFPPPSLTLSQITPPQSVSHSGLSPAQHPLRC